MNIFRSEEHARRSSQFDATFEHSLKPLATWLQVFSGEVFRNRNREDYVSWFSANQERVVGELMAGLERF